MVQPVHSVIGLVFRCFNTFELHINIFLNVYYLMILIMMCISFDMYIIFSYVYNISFHVFIIFSNVYYLFICIYYLFICILSFHVYIICSYVYCIYYNFIVVHWSAPLSPWHHFFIVRCCTITLLLFMS